MKFNDMVKSIRRSASGQIAKYDGALGKFRSWISDMNRKAESYKQFNKCNMM